MGIPLPLNHTSPQPGLGAGNLTPPPGYEPTPSSSVMVSPNGQVAPLPSNIPSNYYNQGALTPPSINTPVSNSPLSPMVKTLLSSPPLPSIPPVPPPHVAVPSLYPSFNQFPANPAGTVPVANQTGVYPGQQPNQTQTPQLGNPNETPPATQQNQNQGQNPQNTENTQANQPQQPPENQQNQQNQNNQPPDLGSKLDDATVRRLNEQLNSTVEGVRADAGMEFYELLQVNPELATNPTYKPYIDAFLLKILRDPSAVVRQTAELILELGLVPNPSGEVKAELQKLAKKTGPYNIEGGIAQQILSNLNKTPGQSASDTTGVKSGSPQNSGMQDNPQNQQATSNNPQNNTQNGGQNTQKMPQFVSDDTSKKPLTPSWKQPQQQSSQGQQLNLMSNNTQGGSGGIPGTNAQTGQKLNMTEGAMAS